MVVYAGVYLFYQRPDWLVQPSLEPTPTPTRGAVSWQAEAEIYATAGDYRAAIAGYQQVARLEPDNADPLVAQARLLLTLRRVGDAYRVARQAVDVDPQNVDALSILARTLDWQGNYEEAVNYALDALELAPDDATTLAVLGEIYTDVGNWSRAADYLDQALKSDPRNVLAHRNLAYLHEVQGNYTMAIAQYDQAIQLAPERADIYIEKGRQYQALADWESAIDSYREAVAVAETAVTLDALGWGLYLSGDFLEALRQLRRAVELDPDYGPAVAHLGMAYYARFGYEEAVPHLERGVTLLGDESRIEYYYSLGLAHIYKKPEECDKAIPWLQKALELDPNSRPALEGLTLCQG